MTAMKVLFSLLAFSALASAFVAPVRVIGRSRTSVVASASGDYLASTQKTVDVSRAAASVKKIKTQFERNPKQFKRDPKLFKPRHAVATTPGNMKAAAPWRPTRSTSPTPVNTSDKTSLVIGGALVVVALAAILMFLK